VGSAAAASTDKAASAWAEGTIHPTQEQSHEKMFRAGKKKQTETDQTVVAAVAIGNGCLIE